MPGGLIAVSGDLTIGSYKITPPPGLWYLPLQTKNGFDTIVTRTSFYDIDDFWKITKQSMNKIDSLNINIIVTRRKSNYSEFLNSTWDPEKDKDAKLNISDLPEEYKALEDIGNWDCKFVIDKASKHTLRCKIVADSSISIYSDAYDKDNLVEYLPILEEIIRSLEVL